MPSSGEQGTAQGQLGLQEMNQEATQVGTRCDLKDCRHPPGKTRQPKEKAAPLLSPLCPLCPMLLGQHSSQKATQTCTQAGSGAPQSLVSSTGSHRLRQTCHSHPLLLLSSSPTRPPNWHQPGATCLPQVLQQQSPEQRQSCYLK